MKSVIQLIYSVLEWIALIIAIFVVVMLANAVWTGQIRNGFSPVRSYIEFSQSPGRFLLNGAFLAFAAFMCVIFAWGLVRRIFYVFTDQNKDNLDSPFTRSIRAEDEKREFFKLPRFLARPIIYLRLRGERSTAECFGNGCINGAQLSIGDLSDELVSGGKGVVDLLGNIQRQVLKKRWFVRRPILLFHFLPKAMGQVSEGKTQSLIDAGMRSGAASVLFADWDKELTKVEISNFVELVTR